ncbi:polysaccharide lyase family 1 protein [Hyaloscypha bicolor E]|uniref:Polysaccharide lyase family 1 protein n=1 Tax=Hyaloscypha bicolor E TaxID=1095630 RepID=A0A2J6SJP9_9HELO|nr:polysaccharide lyase family 1 protein [Hyaloscypha bicolor E]PMD50985.1 polysaccharide lyase family 1 protein [Hyaloscypha bicolor E]
MILSTRSLLASAAAALFSRANAQNAFAGAMGFGVIATGGNSGTTYHVTTLADSGTGSFRDAVSSSNRNIVFDVSGYIVLKSAVSLSSSITINGQTAPSPGISIMAGEVSASDKSNIIIRNTDTGKSAFNMGGATNVILDHCSVAYGQWDSIDGVGVTNITISNSIIAFPIGQQFDAHIEGNQATYYGNLWVSGHNRQPLSKANSQYINNIVHDIINNYFIAGPSTTSVSNYYYQVNAGQSVYAKGNYADTSKDGVFNGAPENKVGSAVVLAAPWASDSAAMASRSAADAYTYVLANAGASPRDEVDAFAVSTVQTLGTSGIIYTNQASTGLSNGGYGTL